MPDIPALTGLWPPIATPFATDGTVDFDRLATLGRRLMAEGSRGLVVLGTTGEATSLGLGERHAVIDALPDRGIAPGRLIVGSGSCALPDAVELTRHAGEIAAAAVLLLPPFYYKPVDDEGLYRFVSEVIERVGPRPPRVLLYHFPSLATVGWSFALIARLLAAFPGIVVGIKDSSGDEGHTLSLMASFPMLAVFPGSESNLSSALRAGAAGFITASGNVNARALAALIADPDAADAPARLAEANAVRMALKTRGLFPSVKAVIARQLHDDTWLSLRLPLTGLSADARQALYTDPAIVRLVEQAVTA